MIQVHVGTDGTQTFQVYGCSRVRKKSVRVYVGSFASRRDAEHADAQHRVTQRGIRAGELPPALDHTRALGDALDAWLRAIKDQRSHDEYSARMRLYVRPVFDSTPVVRITKSTLLELRSDSASAPSRSRPKTVNGVFATLSTAFNYFIEQCWCSDNPTKFIKLLPVTQRPFLWLQSAGEVQKLLSECNDNIRNLVAVLVGTGVRLDEALHLHWTDIDLQHRVIHMHRGRRGAPKSGRLHHVRSSTRCCRCCAKLSWRRARTSCSGRHSARRVRRPATAQQDERLLPVQGRRRARRPLEEVPRPRPSPHLRRHPPRVRRRHLQALEDPRPLRVAITQQVYAHLHPDAFAENYSRVAFEMPDKGA